MGMLDGKVAIITGSGRGIGSATAKLLAAQGALVIVSDLDPNPAEETAAAIRNAGGQAAIIPGDVTDPAFPAQLIKGTLDTFGGIDIIVNNAGYTWDAVIQNMTDKQWYAIMDVHTTAPFRILREAAHFIRDAAKKKPLPMDAPTRVKWSTSPPFQASTAMQARPITQPPKQVSPASPKRWQKNGAVSMSRSTAPASASSIPA